MTVFIGDADRRVTLERGSSGLGGPGRLPTRGSHGSGRAQLTHPARQVMVSLPKCYPVALC